MREAYRGSKPKPSGKVGTTTRAMLRMGALAGLLLWVGAVAFYCVKVRPNEPIKIVDGSTGKSKKGKKKKKEKARNKQEIEPITAGSDVENGGNESCGDEDEDEGEGEEDDGEDDDDEEEESHGGRRRSKK